MESSQRNSELSLETSAIEKLPVELVTKIFRICQTAVVDDEDLDYSSILHPKHAPLLLCQVSSGWRKLAENTPRLWDTIPLLTSDLVSEDKFMRTLLGRSRELPLYIIVTAPRETPKVGNEQFLVRLWECHDRFERLVFRIPASDFLITSLPSPTILL
ncbi:hypothetical protein B0H19DRAFT_1273858 [Mycena capillaripes]|nr:hypothetical protein B0H19DRAFT_1273858 [Mycena capillaripes]